MSSSRAKGLIFKTSSVRMSDLTDSEIIVLTCICKQIWNFWLYTSFIVAGVEFGARRFGIFGCTHLLLLQELNLEPA